MTDGRRFRILTVVDNCTRECLALVADTSISGLRVARELDEIIRCRGRPMTIVSDNGTELTSNAILSWADQTKVGWHYIAPGKPQQNGYNERLASPAFGTTADCATSCSMRRCSARCNMPEACWRTGGATTTRSGRTPSWAGWRPGPTPTPSAERPAGPCATRRLRAPAYCQPSPTGLRSTPDSRYDFTTG